MKKIGLFSVICVVSLGFLLLLAGCGGGGSQAILDLVPLEAQMVAEYGVSDILVELQNGNTLGFTVIDDASGSLLSAQRAEEARGIAEFVCEHYRSMDRIDRIWVAFKVQDGSVVVTNAAATYSFESELACRDK